MAVKSARVTVTAAATKLNVTVEHDPSSQPAYFGQHFMVRNRDSSLSVFVGGADVSATTGFEVLPGEVFRADLLPGDNVYGITSSGSAVCHVTQVGI